LIQREVRIGDRQAMIGTSRCPFRVLQKVQLQVTAHAQPCPGDAEIRARQLLETEHVAIENLRLREIGKAQ
jgi:hypothetical protein